VQTNHVAFCWSGKAIFAPTGDGRTRILSYPDLSPLLFENSNGSSEFALRGHTSTCLSAQMSPTGRFLATGGGDSIIALWDTKKWVCQRTITNMVGPVRSISTFASSPTIITGPSSAAGTPSEKLADFTTL